MIKIANRPAVSAGQLFKMRIVGIMVKISLDKSCALIHLKKDILVFLQDGTSFIINVSFLTVSRLTVSILIVSVLTFCAL